MKIFFNKNGELGQPQKGKEQGDDFQRYSLTSLVHFDVQLHEVNREVITFGGRRSLPCFCPFSTLLVKTFSLDQTQNISCFR